MLPSVFFDYLCQNLSYRAECFLKDVELNSVQKWHFLKFIQVISIILWNLPQTSNPRVAIFKNNFLVEGFSLA